MAHPKDNYCIDKQYILVINTVNRRGANLSGFVGTISEQLAAPAELVAEYVEIAVTQRVQQAQ